MQTLSTILLLLGLFVTAASAWIAAEGVILTERHATELASAKWDLNVELRDALLAQSAKAKWGLRFVVLGTFLQVFGTIAPLWPQPAAPAQQQTSTPSPPPPPVSGAPTPTAPAR